MLAKYAPVLALLATSILADDPLCLDPSGRVQVYNFAYSQTVDDGRTLAFCYNSGGGLTVDDNWVTDISAILTTLVQTGNSARCVDCLPSAEPAGCTGKSTIWNIDGNQIGDIDPPPLDNFSKDVFIQLIKDAAADGTNLKDFGSDVDPVLTIDLPGGFREQQFYIIGDGDTC